MRSFNARSRWAEASAPGTGLCASLNRAAVSGAIWS